MLPALKRYFYLQISPDRLSVRNVKTGDTVELMPEVAVKRGKKTEIVGTGAMARAQESATVEIVNPFGNPRSLVSDSNVAQLLLKEVVRGMPAQFSLGAPVFVVHPLVVPAGGEAEGRLGRGESGIDQHNLVGVGRIFVKDLEIGRAHV